MRKVVTWVTVCALVVVGYLAATGWRPSWAIPTCAEATEQARAELVAGINQGLDPYERNLVQWRIVEACEPEGAARILAACNAYDEHRDSESCREVPVDPGREEWGAVGNLWSWIPKP